MDLAVTGEELRELLAATPFTRHYGFILEAIGDGKCALSVPFQEAFERPGGIVSGGARLIFGVAESTGGMAACWRTIWSLTGRGGGKGRGTP